MNGRLYCCLGALILLALLVVDVDGSSLKNRKKRDDHDDQTAGENDLNEHKKKAKHHAHPSNHWGYRNEDKNILPKNWHKSHPKCYGERQSPINIETEASVYDKRLEDIHIEAESDSKENVNEKQIWTMKNNGHSVVLNPETEIFKFKMLPDNQTYKFLQMHFHWRGSEHFVDGHRYSGELHLVHQNVEDENKFAVLGFLLERSNQDNENLNAITEKLVQVTKFNSKFELAFNLGDLLPLEINDYFRYPGSLTTPGCDEKVEWFVVSKPILKISEDQLLDFQDVEDSHGFPILSNSRPIQEINDRIIKRSFCLPKESHKEVKKKNHKSDGHGKNKKHETSEENEEEDGHHSSSSWISASFAITTSCLLLSVFANIKIN